MYDYQITFRSLTAAQRADMALLRQGIDAQLIRAPRSLSAMGCGYALQPNGTDICTVLSVLRREGIGFQRVFRIRPGFAPEEVAM